MLQKQLGIKGCNGQARMEKPKFVPSYNSEEKSDRKKIQKRSKMSWEDVKEDVEGLRREADCKIRASNQCRYKEGNMTEWS